MKYCDVVHFGLVEYQSALRLQERLLNARQHDRVGDTVLALQHPPVFTIGRAGTADHVLVPAAVLTREGIAVYAVNRGGDVTYHGPGQLVVYPILRLADHGDDVRLYARMIEETAIRLLADFGIAAERIKEYPGVWVGSAKIAAIGVAVSGGVTMHGMAINVDPHLAHFGMINPCGLGKPVTSMRQVLGEAVDLAEVQRHYVKCWAEVFGVATTERFVEGVEDYDQEVAALVDGAGAQRG